MIRHEPLFECIPNFSEGRSSEILEALTRAAQVPGVSLLGLHSDWDHHRSVMTLVGPRAALLESVFGAVQVAVERIDLTTHHGIHPRIGAVDVIPFVPLHEATMADAVEMAHSLGERVARELGVPVYYYEEAAMRVEHQNLADVRRGQFERLAQRMVEDAPDMGPQAPHRTAGAVAIGARIPLIAFNVYLETTDVRIARAIAKRVRGSSGGLPCVKALGLNTINKGCVQVSMNLTNYRVTSLYTALQRVREEANHFGVAIKETELVGFIPFEAIEEVVRESLALPNFRKSDILEMAITEKGEH